MPARGCLQRVRHNTYTVCYVRLVADHHLLVVPHSPRPAHLIRTVILHNLYGGKTDRKSKIVTVEKSLRFGLNTGLFVQTFCYRYQYDEKLH